MIITKENKKIVLTPDEVEKFINQFTEIEKQQSNG
jgi:hypothetical protein